MSTQLSAEWQQKIDDEALELTKGFKDNNDYQAGYIQGFQDGYSKGAVAYGTQLVEAQDRIKTLEDALGRIANQDDDQVLWTDAGIRCRDIANKALSSNNKTKGENDDSTTIHRK